MEKTSKVTRATANGTWNSNFGLLYRFEIEFENGDVGEYLSKKAEQTMFKIGESIMYTLDGKEYNGKMFYKIKPIPQQPQNTFTAKAKDPETAKHIMRMSVLKVAGDLVVHDKIKLSKLIDCAIALEAYVNTGMNTFGTYKVDTTNNYMNDAIDKTNDLPF
jgi:hypothetical protein